MIKFHLALAILRAAGVLNTLIDERAKRFRRGGLTAAISAVALAVFWRNADPLDAITWRDPQFEDSLRRHGAMLA